MFWFFFWLAAVAFLEYAGIGIALSEDVRPHPRGEVFFTGYALMAGGLLLLFWFCGMLLF
ncbi:MAG TPA: hypothetical protein PK597_07175 [Oscillospiraceae bacterium]|nr:hypothetical protein [Oscillospiraceae bacterium]